MKIIKKLSWIGLVLMVCVVSCKKEDSPPTPVAKSSAKAITKFTFAALNLAVDATISGTTLSATVPAATDITKLVPTITVSDKATVSPASGAAQDFSKSVTYTVTAEDGSTQAYTVSVDKEKGGTVYIGNLDGVFYAIDATTGVKKWEFKTGASINSSPTVVNGVVFFASWDKKLYALDAETGAKKWESNPSTVKLLQPFAAPLVSDGLVYYPGDNYFYALDATTGTKKWEFRDDEIYGWQASPTLVNGIVYASIRGTGVQVGIYGLDAKTGARKWKADKTFITESSPAVIDGLLYAGSEFSGFNAFDISSGVTKWTFDSGLITNSSPTVANGVVYIGTSAVANTNNDKLYALDAKTGAKKWEFKTPDGGPDYSSPIVASGIVYIGAGGTLYAVDATSGIKKWEAKPEANNLIASGAVVATGLVYQGIGKKLYAFDAATGTKKWEYDTGRTIDQSSPCVVAKDGTVYHAGISGMVQ
ncbi:PQQ-binding-like beta-propeller repeat protein [Runella sp. MFBS21]|uniref:PQQ-binding-like beta-propeller repeat protein n=1 Tax=Runella sp. MFBS21 TaxID=3034018 RepID=UPI0023F80F72|nr:PQQ-binding-like beta-propeller repeat protein [Runella sp. MFBS21]MDF7818745.1 PQQ-binding-like beta-propeller repeat protein [Runella sp. MFBS21]